jgi:hypothetical protein
MGLPLNVTAPERDMADFLSSDSIAWQSTPGSIGRFAERFKGLPLQNPLAGIVSFLP